MDLITAIWILLWGLLPPIATGYWAFRMGKQGRDQAFELRDQAIDQVHTLEGEIKNVKNELSRIESSIQADLRNSTDDLRQEIGKTIHDMEVKIQHNFSELNHSDQFRELTDRIKKEIPKAEEIVKQIKIPTAQEISKEIKIPTAQEFNAQIKIPDEVLDQLKESIIATVKGTWGNIVKGLAADAGAELDTEAKTQALQVSISEKIKLKLLDRIMNIL